jgi:glycosyltransferase involved in cell wall biosynthesis
MAARVLRVIARLNVGGPAHHVSLLGGRLDHSRYDTLLVHGSVGNGEASFERLARDEGCRVRVVPSLRPEIDPAADARALRDLVRVIRDFQPHIVHTHTAKAGFLGRMAATLAGRRRPAIVHTYHGHVLEGYFGPARNAVYRGLEKSLARVSDTLVGVSEATVDDLVRLGVAPRERFRVVPIGLDLDRFAAAASNGAGDAFRQSSGVRPGEVLMVFTGRLVPIKRVDVLLHAFARLRSQEIPARLAVVGDGPERGALEHLARELEIDDYVTFHGFLDDSSAAVAAADVAALSSDNEGTPVALIEAAAGGVPAVATAVGGVAEVVTPAGGLLVPPGDSDALASAMRRLALDADVRHSMGDLARGHVLERYSVDRLVGDIDELYDDLLTRRSGGVSLPLRSPFLGQMARTRPDTDRARGKGPGCAT